MKLGISTYSLFGALEAGEMTVLDVIDYIAEIGGEHVEIVPLGYDLTDNPELIASIRSRAEQNGLELSNYAIDADFLLEDEEALHSEIERVKRQVDIAAGLGVKLMRHDVASSPDVSIGHFNAVVSRLADACREIARYAAQYGITTSVENHRYFIQQSDRVQTLVQAVNEPNFRTTLDMGNFVCADEDPLAAVRNNLPYASIVHAKDFYIRPAAEDPGEGWFRSTAGKYLRGSIFGQGDLNSREALRLIKQSGYDGYISLEFEGMEPCRDGARIGLQNLRRLLEEV
ncbi:sugar phosphate isomerase/epimerase family protein [Paenibacillus pinistramenti]|uniref:sugar phosphate isomerase/epimerase family protein n=1 Tax=Paenibacillus pinistramenti TaxID=1768003 RepID=UPI0011088CED|nr:sugar phosphate isomerase/epimerase [Paenibacillus pinistramenti]